MPENNDTEAMEKLRELLRCGNERVELAAAKEILAMEEAEKEARQDSEIRLDVEIRIVE